MIFAKDPNLDVLQGSEYASVIFLFVSLNRK